MLEVKIIDALSELGISAHRAEMPGNSASISARLSDGSMLLVFAARSGTLGGDYSVIDERRVEGVAVQRVRYPSGPTGDRFDCTGDTYEVRTEVPPGFADMDAFLGRFIRALGCGA